MNPSMKRLLEHSRGLGGCLCSGCNTHTHTHTCRLANVASNESISSGSVAFQYWFNGPMDVPEGADPLSQLTMDCLDATTGAPQESTCHLQIPVCRRLQVHKG